MTAAVSRCRGLLPGLGRLRETLAQGAKLLDLGFAQLGVTLLEVVRSLAEPRLLMLGIRTHDTALHDVLKHFVACFLERSRGRRWSRLSIFICLFGHEVSAWEN
jgi:hypothetical protein